MKKCILIMLLVLMLSACSSQFDQATWMNEPEQRNGMVQSLINQYELEGMTESEIVGLLGEPAQKLDKPVRQFIYSLGRAGLGVDDRLLRLYFN